MISLLLTLWYQYDALMFGFSVYVANALEMG